MVNEKITEDFFRDSIKKDELYQKGYVILEEQSSRNIIIDKLLKNASKSGTGVGRPEFIIQFKENPDLIIVVECKPIIKFHKSKEGDKYRDYAVDGVLLYSSFLSKEFDVLSIAISGENKKSLRISHFLQLKNTQEAHPIFKEDSILTLMDYLNGYKTNERKFNQDFQELLKYSKTLNDKLHSLKVKESDRSLLISGALIALTDKAFQNSYTFQKPKELAENLVNTINNKLTDVENENISDIITTYSFIKTHTILSKEENELRDIITEVDSKINNFNKTYKYFDTLGQFYIEFLRYANNDKGLGIVLTPPHITELFSEIANINKDSIVLDTCCGTGGFLISAMRKMIEDAAGDTKKKEIITHKQIVGVEFQHEIFALVCSNMYIHGDGRSNLIKGSCFNDKIMNQVKNFKPNTGFLNPPYKSTKTDPEELEFVLNNLSLLEKGGICVAIVPMSCALVQSNIIELKEKLLREHTLEAVFSMPGDLFHNSIVGVNTCIMVFKAKEKHPDNYKTYFGYWRDDGFIKRKNGREDYNNKWNEIKKCWLENYQNKEEIEGFSVKKYVTAKEEWCVESYMETDYSNLTKGDFEKTLKESIVFSLKSGLIKNVSEKSITNSSLDLNTNKWKNFKIDGVLFDIKKGERLVKEKRIEGNIPLITSTSINNGVVNYISYDDFKEDKKIFKDKVTIDMFFNVFYHNYEYFSDDNVHTLIPKNFSPNKYVCLFLATVLRRLQYKYNFGRQVRLHRLNLEEVKLPVDKKGNPDWQFMEDYIKSLPYSSNI